MIRIRAALAKDAGAVAAIYAPYVTQSTISFETEAPDAAEMARRMASADGLYPWYVAVDEADDLLDYCYACPFRARAAYRFTVETTVYVAGAAHRRGIGRALYEALIDKLERQGFVQAVGIIALPNEGSVKLHEALGFELVGINCGVGYKFGTWHDVGIWQRALAPAGQPSEA